MGELRRDPLLHFEVIIAEGRTERPDQFRRQPPAAEEITCPFCEGNEQNTPHETLAYRSSDSQTDQQGWQVRVIPNRYPSLQLDYQQPPQAESNFYHAAPANGVQEVVIESPKHLTSFTQLPAENAKLTFKAYQQRMLAIRDLGKYQYVQIFKNVGPAAGASLAHTHSQIMAIQRSPQVVTQLVNASQKYLEQQQHTYWSKLIEQELDQQQRVIYVDQDFLVFCPFASRIPFQTVILPRNGHARFEDANSTLLEKLATLTQEILVRIEKVLKFSSYNYLIHTLPFDSKAEDHYHWQLEILPRTTTQAGFEWGTGIFVNPMSPERAAELLRSAN